MSSVSSLAELDLSLYTQRLLADTYALHHRVVGDEVEIVVKAKTETWVGIGWKPTGSINCRHIDKEGERTVEFNLITRQLVVI